MVKKRYDRKKINMKIPKLRIFRRKDAITIEMLLKLIIALLLLVVILSYLGTRYWDSISDKVTSIFGLL